MTHTFALLEVSKAAWEEIATKLRDAGYQNQIDDDQRQIDMHGIALTTPPQNPFMGDR